jgi:hypothetical protein
MGKGQGRHSATLPKPLPHSQVWWVLVDPGMGIMGLKESSHIALHEE